MNFSCVLTRSRLVVLRLWTKLRATGASCCINSVPLVPIRAIPVLHPAGQRQLRIFTVPAAQGSAGTAVSVSWPLIPV